MNEKLKACLKKIPVIRTIYFKIDGMRKMVAELQAENTRLILMIEALSKKQYELEVRMSQRRILVNDKISELNIKSKRYDYCADRLGELIPRFEQGEYRCENIKKELGKTKKLLDETRMQMMEKRLKENVKIGKDVLDAKKAAEESVWSAVFHDTIWNSKWLIDKKFSPGRWAVGYQYLYVLYRVLDETHPQDILELGLGQSTKMITQYVKSAENCQHFVTEHDSSWMDFFGKSNYISERTNIMKFELCKKKVLTDEQVTAYASFYEAFKGKKFDLISIDAPFGAPVNIYARTDILDLIPSCLKNEFIIMIDDYNRIGEQNMVTLLKEKMIRSKIEFVEGCYSGKKDTLVLASLNYSFLTTL